MGIIQKETIKGSTWSYVGAFLGFVNTGLLFPKIFSTSEIGLLSVIVAISALFSQFSSLGMNSVTARLFPYFKSENKDKYGFLTLLLLVTSIGFAVSMLVGISFRDWIISSKESNSDLLGQYAFYLIPMTLFTLFFNVLDVYNKMLYDITSGIFLKEFLLRVLNFISIILFFIGWIDFDVFVFLYVLSYFVPLAGLFIVLLIRGEIVLKLSGFEINPQMKREIMLVAAFGILAGFSGVIGEQLDKYLINRYLGLHYTGVYTITFFICSMILLPSRALNKISSTLIADCWKANDLNTIEDVYQKSSITQYTFGLFLFILIVANIHNIFGFLPAEYAGGENLMYVFGAMDLIIMLSGVSFSIVSTAKYYWHMSTLMLMQIIIIIGANILLIPSLGMMGAALSLFISVFTTRVSSMIIIAYKSKISPFNSKHLYVTVISIITFLVVKFIIPVIPNIYIDSAIRLMIVTLLFVPTIIIFNVSEEITQVWIKLSKLFLRK